MQCKQTQHANSSIDQDRLLAFLKQPESYPHSPPSVKVVQTHGAFVAIAPPYVYKVKKPVDMGFLDFSTVEKRHFYTHREVELNRRLCPDIYLGVVPIVPQGSQLAFHEGAETGEIVDYAVKMKQLDERFFLDRLLDENRVSTADIDRIVAKLVPFYERQDPSDEVTQNGRIEVLKKVTSNNLRDAEEFVGQTVKEPALAALQHFSERFFLARAALLRSRPEGEWIRDCHGDLHREHIHLGHDCVSIYDCIEFNDKFRYIDVAAEVAFLAMDLDFAGRSDLGRHFVDEMARALNDNDMPKLINFYKCYRAAVRGKVESLRAQEQEVPEDRREASRRRARRYYQLALNYAVVDAKPTVVVVMGRIASGKSTVAAGLAETLGWPVFSSDRLRKEIAGLPIRNRPATETRRTLYGEEMTERTYAWLNILARSHCEQGQSLVLDGTFGRRQYRDYVRDALGRSCIDVGFVELNVPDATVKARLKQRENRADTISDARLEDFETLASRYEEPAELTAWELNQLSGEQGIDPIVQKICNFLIERRLAALPSERIGT